MAKKWNMSERGVRKYCAEDKIPGAFLTGKTWNIPENAEKPKRKNKKNKCVPGKKGIFIYLQRKHYFGSCYCYNNFYVGNSFGDKLHNSS